MMHTKIFCQMQDLSTSRSSGGGRLPRRAHSPPRCVPILESPPLSPVFSRGALHGGRSQGGSFAGGRLVAADGEGRGEDAARLPRRALAGLSLSPRVLSTEDPIGPPSVVLFTMRLDLTGSDSFEPFGIFIQNIWSGAR